MKKFICGFLMGFSFFVTRWLFDIATTDIANKSGAFLLYGCFPLLILIYILDSKQKN